MEYAPPQAPQAMPSQSDKQYAAMLMMQNLSADEKMMMQQQAQAAELRKAGMQPSAGRDFGSQSARALQGIGGAIGDVQNKQMMDEYRKNSARNMGTIKDILMPGANPSNPYGATSPDDM